MSKEMVTQVFTDHVVEAAHSVLLHLEGIEEAIRFLWEAVDQVGADSAPAAGAFFHAMADRGLPLPMSPSAAHQLCQILARPTRGTPDPFALGAARRLLTFLYDAKHEGQRMATSGGVIAAVEELRKLAPLYLAARTHQEARAAQLGVPPAPAHERAASAEEAVAAERARAAARAKALPATGWIGSKPSPAIPSGPAGERRTEARADGGEEWTIGGPAIDPRDVPVS